jgi:flagellar biogenesis protein FliO
MLMTMGGALLLVIGLFLVFAWMMRRTSTRTGGMLPQGVVEVLGHQTIAGRQQVHLLRIGKRLLLVSVMPDSMETLTEITDPMEVDRIAGICRQSGSGSSTGAFQAVMRQFNQDPNQNQDPIPTVDQLRQRIGG